jgi:DNA-binding NarL/FixJ family response regulator
VLAALMDGQQAETIAASSGLSETTIRSQIRGVLIKLGVGSQLAAVATARRAGWTPDSFAIRQTG